MSMEEAIYDYYYRYLQIYVITQKELAERSHEQTYWGRNS